eukprot:4478922-Heterocapsa_arctica.AAC.1
MASPSRRSSRSVRSFSSVRLAAFSSSASATFLQQSDCSCSNRDCLLSVVESQSLLCRAPAAWPRATLASHSSSMPASHSLVSALGQ